MSLHLLRTTTFLAIIIVIFADVTFIRLRMIEMGLPIKKLPYSTYIYCKFFCKVWLRKECHKHQEVSEWCSNFVPLHLGKDLMVLHHLWLINVSNRPHLNRTEAAYIFGKFSGKLYFHSPCCICHSFSNSSSISCLSCLNKASCWCQRFWSIVLASKSLFVQS